MSEYARGGDNYDPPEKSCRYPQCIKPLHISKAGNKLDVCKDHLNWLYETHIPKENKLKEIKTQLDKIYKYLISIEHIFKEEE